MKHIPNSLTILRLLLLPVIIWLLLLPDPWAAWTCFWLYAFGAFTDWLDGWIARKFNCTSTFGAMMDPISDKIYVASLMIMLIASGRLDETASILVVIIMIREFVVSGLREYLGPKGITMPVVRLAKWKTAIQMIALALFIPAPIMPSFETPALACLGLACLLTVVTGGGYIKTAWQHMKASSDA